MALTKRKDHMLRNILLRARVTWRMKHLNLVRFFSSMTDAEVDIYYNILRKRYGDAGAAEIHEQMLLECACQVTPLRDISYHRYKKSGLPIMKGTNDLSEEEKEALRARYARKRKELF